MGQSITRAVIVGSAPFSDASYLATYLRDGDLLVAADGGQTLLEAMGKTPSFVIGDFDSSCPPKEGDVPCRMLPVQKDDTDVLAAVRHLLAEGIRDFLFLGVLGGRLDHTIANLFVLRFLKDHGANGMLVDERHEVSMLSAGVYQIEPREGFLFSLFPYGGQAHEVCVKDALYNLENATLDTAFPIGVSNAFLEKAATVSFSEGFLLCILAKV